MREQCVPCRPMLPLLIMLLLIMPLLVSCGQPDAPQVAAPPSPSATTAIARSTSSQATRTSVANVARPTSTATRATRATPTAPLPLGTPTLLAAPATRSAAAPPATARVSATPDLAESFPRGFVDQRQRRYMIVSLTSGALDYGRLSLAIPGVGLFSTAHPAQVTALGPTQVTVSYTGTAYLDAAAKLRSSSPLFTQLSGKGVPVDVRLAATLDIGIHTGEITLEHDGQTYLLHCVAPPHDADATLQEVVAAMNRADWVTMYRLSSQEWHDHMDEAQFVAWISSAMRTVGTLAPIQPIDPLTYTTDRDGVQSAVTTVALTVTTPDGTSNTEQQPLVLIFEEAGWRFATTIPKAPVP